MINKVPSVESFVELCHLLYNRNLVCGVGGNVSVRCDDNIMTTLSGISLRDMTSDDIIIINSEGNVVEGKGNPTKEFCMHSRILEKREDVNVVCHIHGGYLIAASTKMTPGNNSLPPITPGFCFFAYPLVMLPFYVPGTEELANVVANHFAETNAMALLLQNHGLITVGADMRQTLNITEEINEAAEVFVLSNGEVTTIPDEDIKRIF